MPRNTRLQRRGARYYLRAKVPADLRTAIGKREIREALGTSDPREAVKRVRKRSVAVDELFETHRRKLALKAAGLVAASPTDLDRIVLQSFHDKERWRVESHSQADPDDTDEILEILNEDEAILSSGLKEDHIRLNLKILHTLQGRGRLWLINLLARRPRKVAAVALANKMARTLWAMMVSGEVCRRPLAV